MAPPPASPAQAHWPSIAGASADLADLVEQLRARPAAAPAADAEPADAGGAAAPDAQAQALEEADRRAEAARLLHERCHGSALAGEAAVQLGARAPPLSSASLRQPSFEF